LVAWSFRGPREIADGGASQKAVLPTAQFIVARVFCIFFLSQKFNLLGQSLVWSVKVLTDISCLDDGRLSKNWSRLEQISNLFDLSSFSLHVWLSSLIFSGVSLAHWSACCMNTAVVVAWTCPTPIALGLHLSMYLLI
jgi:hypothetical protein